jgi:hypothetical protein
MRTRLENDERIGVNSHPSCGARVLAEQPWSPDILWVRSWCHYTVWRRNRTSEIETSRDDGFFFDSVTVHYSNTCLEPSRKVVI